MKIAIIGLGNRGGNKGGGMAANLVREAGTSTADGNLIGEI